MGHQGQVHTFLIQAGTTELEKQRRMKDSPLILILFLSLKNLTVLLNTIYHAVVVRAISILSYINCIRF